MKICRIFHFILILSVIFSCTRDKDLSGISNNDLKFETLALSWDEAIPLGNGMLGALIWEKDGNLRFSLDRADLWYSTPI